MLVSAIIPCYNAQSTIGRAMDSLLQQTVVIDQIIVINDGSTDASLEVLNAYQLQHNQMVIINQENQGVGVARNNAIRKALGTYILTLDGDDFFEPSFVEKALIKFSENENLGAVMCGYTRVVKGEKVLPYIPEPISFQSCLIRNGAIACLLFKKKAIIEAGLYDEEMQLGYEDWDLNIRILKLGYAYGVVREVLFNYTDTDASRNDRAERKDLELRMQLFYKYREDYEQHSAYFFKEFIKENNRLKKENQRIKNSTSFKCSHSIITLLERLKNIFKSN
ncbi:glycosyltransferase family 2 protein [Nonlabens sp. MB-3u-79]|uniref:glycosyltransferase family 2 protein n=1 Tax=Nonlabens sp. MB-3u-79 TaxID=2058134 RepID=UPI000C30417F|nr:glycosyltransferase family A protein [Nonlabens sp. MB-3u-79]AUC77994.1 glycosyltransferase family 2 protein [Nonlabens sp. MB-3u-79]